MNLVETIHAAEKALFEHVGYEHDWRIFPVVDHTDMYWAVDRGADSWCRSSKDKAALEYWINNENGDYREEDGDKVYESSIYTYRHLKKWVFRGPEFTLVLEDTHCDLNVWLACYRTDMEVKARS